MRKFIIPKKGLIVRHPKTFSIVPEQGELVNWNGRVGSFWRRRVKDGSVVLGKQEQPQEPVTTSPKIKRKENK
jgi:hypothetical protein